MNEAEKEVGDFLLGLGFFGCSLDRAEHLGGDPEIS